jgi:hypothetical protein
MKKIIAVFIAVVTFVASLNVTVAFHYCGGEFHSVALAATAVKGCCEGEDEHRSVGADNIAVLQGEECCSSHIQQISTDDFQITKYDVSFKSNNVVFLPAIILFQNLQKAFLTDIFQYVFSPPDCLFKSGIASIISLCVFRI